MVTSTMLIDVSLPLIEVHSVIDVAYQVTVVREALPLVKKVVISCHHPY
jgi:hypothetical protein